MVLLCLFLFYEAVFASTTVYFSPQGGCEQKVVDLISESKSQIDIAVYSINNSPIIHALVEAKARGVKIKILTDHTQAAVNANATLDLADRNFDLRLHSVGRIMHNKFGVFDQKKVITGSFNWTKPAEAVNEENCLVLDEAVIVSEYEHRFIDHLWSVNTESKSNRYLNKLRHRSTKVTARTVIDAN